MSVDSDGGSLSGPSMAREEPPPPWLLAAFARQEAALQRILQQQSGALEQKLEDVAETIASLNEGLSCLGIGRLQKPAPIEVASWRSGLIPTAQSVTIEAPDDQQCNDSAAVPDPVIAEKFEVNVPISPTTRGSTNSEQSSTGSCPRRCISRKTCDFLAALLIIINMLTMFVELQWESQDPSEEPDSRSTDDTADVCFMALEYVFSSLYLVELIGRLCDKGLRFLADPINFCDAMVVLTTSIDAFILQPLKVDAGGGIVVIRLVRICRVVRILKVLRVTSHFRELRVLLKALSSSVSTFIWSMSVLAVIIFAAGIFMAQVLSSFVLDDSQDITTRSWVYTYYGSPTRATYTIFEVTFSGGWLQRTRPLIEDVHALFGVFWVLYVVMITFAVTRVIAALFLKQTLSVAGSDEDMVTMEKMKEKEKFANQLRRMFHTFDTSGDGYLSPDEFQALCDSPLLAQMLNALELELYEIETLYKILDDGQGQVSFEEFLGGALRLKGNARSIDAITISHEQHNIQTKLERLSEGVEQLFLLLNFRQASPSMEGTRSSSHERLPSPMTSPVARPKATSTMAAL
mmetsp:Transcript_38446/g.86559  ORF Transcript_38446/g.86559 Transcript_38446/m.86559 type:complete len:575 (-) Transcript_38446:30-1754(-)